MPTTFLGGEVPTVPQRDPELDVAQGRQQLAWLDQIFPSLFGKAKEPEPSPVAYGPPMPSRTAERALGTTAEDPQLKMGQYTAEYPGPSEVTRAKKTGLAYGTPMEAYMEGKGKVSLVTFEEMLKKKTPEAPAGHPVPATGKQEEALQKGWLASRRSSVAQLGFSPTHTSMTDDPTQRLNVAGLYTSQTAKGKPADQIWFDVGNPSAVVHESMHRGIEMLRKEGLLPEKLTYHQDELMVRALMLHHFKDIEAVGSGGVRYPDITEAEQKISKSQINALEKAAADYIAKKHPMGPR